MVDHNLIKMCNQLSVWRHGRGVKKPDEARARMTLPNTGAEKPGAPARHAQIADLLSQSIAMFYLLCAIREQ